MKAAQDLLANKDNAMAEEIETAENNLLNAMLNLRYKADKSILEEVLAEASKVDANAYTAESYAALQAAVAEANDVYNNENASQEEVDAAVTSVQTAMDKDVYKRQTVDKSALENLYNSLKDTDLEQYVDGEAKDTFKAELEKAATLLGSDTATQDEINNAVTSLQAAFDALEKKPVDKHILQYVIEQAIAKKDTDEYKNVIPAVKESYDKALEEAQAVYNDPNASQEEVNQAYAEMIRQIQNPVSYTHLDVYKRQKLFCSAGNTSCFAYCLKNTKMP